MIVQLGKTKRTSVEETKGMYAATLVSGTVGLYGRDTWVTNARDGLCVEADDMRCLRPMCENIKMKELDRQLSVG